MIAPVQNRDLLCQALSDGQAVVLNTDTLPGLHARIDRPQGLTRIQQLKGRDAGKPMLVLAASMQQVLPLLRSTQPWQDHYASRCWPGPFTLIMAAGADLPPAVVAPTGTVAVRVPDREPLRALLQITGPLASTSANSAGEPAAITLEEAAGRFPELLCWHDGAAAPTGVASALIDTTDEPPRLLRPGPLPAPGL